MSTPDPVDRGDTGAPTAPPAREPQSVHEPTAVRAAADSPRPSGPSDAPARADVSGAASDGVWADPTPHTSVAAPATPHDSVLGDDPAADPGAVPARRPRRHAKESRSFLSELPFLVVVAFLLALLIKAFLVQAFYIPSGSMQQTLEIRDRVLVNKLVYDFRDIRRGEIVVFNGLDSFTEETVVAPPANGFERVLRSVGGVIGLGVPGEKDFIKRVIGVPGDRVACCTDGKVTVLPEGESEPVVLEEDYLFEDNAEAFCAAGLGDGSCPVGAEGILVPEGRLWVMGDHRSSSSDSRSHISDANSGTVPQDKVIGRAFVIVWPLDRARLLGVPDTFGALSALPSSALAGTPYALGLLGAVPVVVVRRRWTAGRARRAGRRDRSLPA